MTLVGFVFSLLFDVPFGSDAIIEIVLLLHIIIISIGFKVSNPGVYT